MSEFSLVCVRILWIAVFLGVALGLAGGVAMAGRPGNNAPETASNDAYIALVPEGSAPPNGGSVATGQRFVLDLMVNAGSHPDVDGQASYMTFTNQIIKNARVEEISTKCLPASEVLGDPSTFDVSLQNEVCNGNGPNGDEACIFRQARVEPGSFAFVSGGLNNCPRGCGGNFRVAQIGLCAVASGTARLHWQFSPPAPVTRDTEIIDNNGIFVSERTLFADYSFEVIAGPTNTPAPTPPATPTISGQPPVLVGHVTWQGPPAQPNARQALPISISLRSQSGGPVTEYTGLSTDSAGNFTVSPNVARDSYYWRVKGPRYLAVSGSVELVRGATVNVEMGLLRVGDCNGDNVVNGVDYGIMKPTFGRGPGDPGYDARADLDNDNIVNSGDFGLLVRNYGFGGAPPLSP